MPTPARANAPVPPPPAGDRSYPLSACSAMSMPSTSASVLARNPMVFWITQPSTYARVNE